MLPDEILEIIFNYSNVFDLYYYIQNVCKHWKELAFLRIKVFNINSFTEKAKSLFQDDPNGKMTTTTRYPSEQLQTLIKACVNPHFEALYLDNCIRFVKDFTIIDDNNDNQIIIENNLLDNDLNNLLNNNNDLNNDLNKKKFFLNESILGNCQLKILSLKSCIKLKNLVLQKLFLYCSKNLFNLNELNIEGCRQIIDNNLKLIVLNCPNLKKIYLSGCYRLTNNGIIYLSKLKLTHLGIQGLRLITDNGLLEFCKNCNSLEYLNLQNLSKITGPCLETIVTNNYLNNLKYLILKNSSVFNTNPQIMISNQTISTILNYCNNLIDFDIQGLYQIGHDGLKNARNFTRLNLIETGVLDDTIFEILINNINLNYLELKNCKNITDKTCEYLVENICKDLKVINLTNTLVTDRGVEILLNCYSKERLRVLNVKIPKSIPRDENQPEFTKPFDVNKEIEEAKQFFSEWGFVVFKNVINQSEIDESINDIFNYMESGSFEYIMAKDVNKKYETILKRNDILTWEDKNWPTMAEEGIFGVTPVFTKNILKNRQNENIYKAFKEITNEEKLWVNMDRIGFFRPTLNVALNSLQFKKDQLFENTNVNFSLLENENSKEDNERRDFKMWKTMKNIHIDRNPWLYVYGKNNYEQCFPGSYDYLPEFCSEFNEAGSFNDGIVKVQGLLNFIDNREQDGGFTIVPKFNKYFEKWVELTKNTNLGKKRMSFIILNHIDSISEYGVRIPLRKGDLLIWDICMPHGSSPNNSERMRLCQFIKMFKAPMKLKENRKKIIKTIVKKEMGENELTELGEKLFGLKEWKE
ncbi:hypothetical protein ABK040_011095 [Willaertia magna]